MACDCKLCKRTGQFKTVLERAPEQDKKFWNEIYNALFHSEADRDYYKCVVDGSWPTADEVIISHRKNRAVKEDKGGASG